MTDELFEKYLQNIYAEVREKDKKEKEKINKTTERFIQCCDCGELSPSHFRSCLGCGGKVFYDCKMLEGEEE